MSIFLLQFAQNANRVYNFILSVIVVRFAIFFFFFYFWSLFLFGWLLALSLLFYWLFECEFEAKYRLDNLIAVSIWSVLDFFFVLNRNQKHRKQRNMHLLPGFSVLTYSFCWCFFSDFFLLFVVLFCTNKYFYDGDAIEIMFISCTKWSGRSQRERVSHEGTLCYPEIWSNCCWCCAFVKKKSKK